MDAFGESKLMDLSQVEQTMSTGVDEEGKEVKGQKLIALLLDTFRAKIPKLQKLRLLSIFIASQRDATPEDKRTLVQVSVGVGGCGWVGGGVGVAVDLSVSQLTVMCLRAP